MRVWDRSRGSQLGTWPLGSEVAYARPSKAETKVPWALRWRSEPGESALLHVTTTLRSCSSSRHRGRFLVRAEIKTPVGPRCCIHQRSTPGPSHGASEGPDGAVALEAGNVSTRSAPPVSHRPCIAVLCSHPTRGSIVLADPLKLIRDRLRLPEVHLVGRLPLEGRVWDPLVVLEKGVGERDLRLGQHALEEARVHDGVPRNARKDPRAPAYARNKGEDDPKAGAPETGDERPQEATSRRAKGGTRSWIRTKDLRIKNPMLYRLS